MLIYLHADNPEQRKLKLVSECLNDGGIVIYPTDTVYGLGCNINHYKAVERICQLKGIDVNKSNLTFICSNLSHITNYVQHIDTPLYRIIKHCIPGPYTFVLPAGKEVPKLFRNKKKTIGIRVPNNIICQNLIATTGQPLLSTSIHHTDEIIEYEIDPELIYENYGKQVDMVIHGGLGGNIPSTVLDCTQKSIQIIRQGLGNTTFLN
jgi:tRNA threonylcarbamoyl adenosine modification protein (Sua5/YciO/YrdC/YwlC family)